MVSSYWLDWLYMNKSNTVLLVAFESFEILIKRPLTLWIIFSCTYVILWINLATKSIDRKVFQTCSHIQSFARFRCSTILNWTEWKRKCANLSIISCRSEKISVFPNFIKIINNFHCFSIFITNMLGAVQGQDIVHSINVIWLVKISILLTTSKDLQLSFQPGVFFCKNAIGRCLQNTRPGKYTHTLTLTHTHTHIWLMIDWSWSWGSRSVQWVATSNFHRLVSSWKCL